MWSNRAGGGAVDGAKGLIKPTAFYMVSGQMHFVRSLRELRETLLQAGPAAWHEALAGPWRYQTPLHSLGWDPAGKRLHALRADRRTRALCRRCGLARL